MIVGHQVIHEEHRVGTDTRQVHESTTVKGVSGFLDWPSLGGRMRDISRNLFCGRVRQGSANSLLAPPLWHGHLPS